MSSSEVGLQEPAWALALLACLLAVNRCWAAGARVPERRPMWIALGTANAFGALAAALAILVASVGHGATAAFYVGFAGSLGLLAGVAILARRNLSGARMKQLGDAVLLGTLIIALGGYCVAIPGFSHGDSLLTAVFVVDLCAVVLGALATLAGPTGGPRVRGWWLVAGCASAAIGDGLTSITAAGELRNVVPLTALLWAGTGTCVAVAAGFEREHDEKPQEDSSGRRWMVVRVFLPLAAVLALPAAAGVIALGKPLKAWEAAYFTAFFIFALVFTFGRQAYLLLDNRLAMTRERMLRKQVMRRNEELEALTGLATTMTETLEEQPIIVRGLDALRLAARASSSALYLEEGELLTLAATNGDWALEQDLAGCAESEAVLEVHGVRQVIRFSLCARSRRIGRVTLLRPADDPVDQAELKLLSLLSDQLAIAIQNARDYREKLEQAIRDPLTGLLNHRAFQERLGVELARARRESFEVALVALDLDHFKPINDRCGHAVGDEALMTVARTINGSLRPSDVAGRVGGDEFMVALPAAGVEQAQAVVSRLRTALASVTVGPTRETLTLSAGIAVYPRAAEYQADLMRFADGAMYWSKSSGRDRVSVYSPDSGEALSPEEKAEHAQRASLIRTVHALARAVDAKDGYTHLHSQRVAFYAATLAAAMGIESERVDMIRTAGVLHDVGKIGISDSILLKPGKLTSDEMAEMRRHSELGRDIVAGAGMTEIADWVCHLHERYVGGGYPMGLRGELIPLESRILAAADALEAMTYPRVYRPALTLEEALAELERGAGTQFDPAVAAKLVQLVRSGELEVGNGGIDTVEVTAPATGIAG
ncbi:MAG TPA: diguanylate cyclase [Candidatus Dormibacteraeota bacterium]|nr:diguanylate cyclase [Candidatus Dormibacteraeota bacterium]